MSYLFDEVNQQLESFDEIAPKTAMEVIVEEAAKEAANKSGTKHDAGKLRFSLLPLHALEEVVKVLEFGAAKYGAENWRKLDNLQQRYYDAALRHVIADQKGEAVDDESDLPHLAHAICCLMFKLEDKLLSKGGL
jgi:hypothetical protein